MIAWTDVNSKLGRMWIEDAAVQFGAILREFVWNNWGKPWGTLIRVVGVPAEIWTQHLTEVLQKHLRLGRPSRASGCYAWCQGILLFYRIHVQARWRVVNFKFRSLHAGEASVPTTYEAELAPKSFCALCRREKSLPLKGIESRTVEHVT